MARGRTIGGLISADPKIFSKEKEFFEHASDDELKARSKELGYTNWNSYVRQMRYRGCEKRPAETTPLDPDSYTTNKDNLSDLELDVLDIVSRGAVSVSEISRRIDRSSETVIKLIDSLRTKHYDVKLDEARHEVTIPKEPQADFKPTGFEYFRKYYTIGIVSDTHIGSRYQQMTLLHDAYSLFDERKTDFNLHAGDLFDGMDMYRGQREELFKYDAGQQLSYAVQNYPKSTRQTKTYLCGGQHDYSFYKANGYNILEHLHEQRSDIIYKGFYRADFKVKGVPISLMHPGGGVSYARSYRPQKIVENMVGFLLSAKDLESLKLLLMGHFHVPVHLPSYMGIDAITLPCFQAQTTYLTQKGLMPSIGCLIIKIAFDEHWNLTYIRPEFVNYDAHIRKEDF